MKSLYLGEWDSFIRYYDLPGQGQTIVFLPGLSTPSILGFLSVTTHPGMPPHRAILVDYYGSGASDHPDHFSYTMEDHAVTVAAILDHEGVESCVVVGHSMGGTVAIMLALQRPALVENLVVCEANITPGGGCASLSISISLDGEVASRPGRRSFGAHA